MVGSCRFSLRGGIPVTDRTRCGVIITGGKATSSVMHHESLFLIYINTSNIT
ncbi:hypothetical protein SBF1_430003 [Candidatus Desulfosporosinus infrequens]|uniref:Uncharacterized protein n=1 Tax=Candidatus Desulfosporosinus infrequens TaxID=2043169 RepID=A0A2U3LB10_9FIRM|nr:hypothetical protein SBF1_430003 [Candidatus Desulfosporosinus infrequens]